MPKIDAPFWERQDISDQEPVLDQSKGDKRRRLTRSALLEAKDRRTKWETIAAREIDKHPLISQAITAISWDAVARKAAEPLATFDRYWYRTARQITEVLQAAGLPHGQVDDWRTPEAQEAIAEAELLGLPPVPDAQNFGERSLERYHQSLLEALKPPDARRRAAHFLLTEAWVSIASEIYRTNRDEGPPKTVTAALQDQLTAAGGWSWLESLHLDLATALQPTDNVNSPSLPPIPAFPAFNVDGHGYVMTDVVSIGTRHAFLSPWDTDADGRPIFTYANRSGQTLYAPSRTIFPTAADALKAVENFGDGHVDLLRYISAKYMANKAEGTTGPYGGFYVSIEEFLDARGLQKHKKGGHRSEYAKEIVTMVQDLAGTEVRGKVERYRQGKRGNPEKLVIEAPLIVISQTIRRSSLTGEETPVAWYLRPGDWAAELERLSPQYAVMYRSILRLNTQNEMNAKRIANFLIEEYRIRAHQKTWTQPYRVAALLAGACIEIDRKNPKRFRDRIEAALDVLVNKGIMETPIVASWHYPKPVEAKGRGWLDNWLELGVVIIPRTRSRTIGMGRSAHVSTACSDRARLRTEIVMSSLRVA
jgi:hypothetical protein